MTTPDETAGRVAVITGASSGIGEARRAPWPPPASAPALLARRGDRIQALADELGNGAIAIQADVTDYDSLTVAARPRQGRAGQR
jgi:NADP-dependent 3-hydroxy acid dehydrogenase YdfG